MLYKVLTIISLTIFLSSEIYGAAIAPVAKNANCTPSIYCDMKNDLEMCPTPWNISESDYVSECKNLTFPSPNINFTSNNSNVFLCLALYDTYYLICHSRSNELQLPILQNKTEFDSLMTKEMKNHLVDPLLLCYYFEHRILSPLHNKTKAFVQQLYKELKDPSECMSICWNKVNNTANPLCLAIQVIEKEIEKEKISVKQKLKTSSSKPNISEISLKSITTAMLKSDELSSNQPPNSPLIPNSEQPTEKLTKNTAELHNTNLKNNISKITSKPVVSDKKKPETNEKDKSSAATQGQAPPIDSKESPKMKVDVPNKEIEIVKNEEAANQIVQPNQNSAAEKSSTISDNTVNGDIDVAGEPNYDGIAETEPADLDTNGEVMAPQKEPSNIQDSIQESFGQSANVPKPPRIITDDDSHFFGYFTFFGLFGIGLFVVYHHKHKIFAMLLEGRRSRGSRGRRRPSTANYRKLDCTLEEAVTSQCSSNVTHVIY